MYIVAIISTLPIAERLDVTLLERPAVESAETTSKSKSPVVKMPAVILLASVHIKMIKIANKKINALTMTEEDL